ncbi:hypothetical protein ACA910_009911 [Epithemia clementina (nom. ined.)]
MLRSRSASIIAQRAVVRSAAKRSSPAAVMALPGTTTTASPTISSISRQDDAPSSLSFLSRGLSTMASSESSSTIWPLLNKKVHSDEVIAKVGGWRIQQLKNENKHVSVVRYEHKNRTWTVHHVDYFSEAVAIGFLDGGLLPGDVVLNAMPEHWSETMVLQFACSKVGMTLYQLDHTTAKTNPDAFKESLKQALILTKANVFCSPETHDDVNYIELDKEVIPELIHFDSNDGTPFLSPRYPHLRYCLQTGYDDEEGEKQGFTRIHHFIVPAGTVDEWLQHRSFEPSTTMPMVEIGPSTPLMGTLELNERGIPVGIGKPLSNEQVIAQEGVWETYTKILKKEYHEVGGVGVVF